MVYIYLAEGFEEVEALTVVDVLRRGGCEIRTVSVMNEKAVKGAHGITVEADILFAEADHDSCDMLILPGGLPGAQHLQDHAGLEAQIRAFAKDGKKIAAICAAPMVLGKHGVIKGRKATIYPGMENRLTGAQATGDSVTVDGNIITGQGPAKAMEFALTVLEALVGPEAAGEVASGLLYR